MIGRRGGTAREPICLLAGGGSGGHLLPGLAVADALRRQYPSVRVIFVTSERPIDHRLLAATDYEQIALPIESGSVLRRRPLRFATRLWKSLRIARQLVRDLRPSIVIGTGGFASYPVVRSARGHCPILLLEQNVIPGRTTRRLARFADRIATGFPLVMPPGWPADRTMLTGNPLRHEFGDLIGTSPVTDPREILILGGSGGASHLNQMIGPLMNRLGSALAGWRIVHQTGEYNPPETELWRTTEIGHSVSASFFEDLPSRMARSSLIISRAGAMTVSEVLALGVPAVLIPLPTAADDHQTANARYAAEVGNCRLIPQALTPDQTAEKFASVLPVELERLTTSPRSPIFDDSPHLTATERVIAEIARLTGW